MVPYFASELFSSFDYSLQNHTLFELAIRNDATYKTTLRKNTYSDLSMGVVNPDWGHQQMIRGTLHKFNGVMNVEIVDETYSNIGAFTLEHLKYVLLRMKGE